MSISTVNKPEDRKEKLRMLREFHRATFEELGIPDAYFLPKFAYNPSGKSERMIGLFASEVAKGQDIYVEFADSDADPQDPERRLYKWRYNPNFREEYDILEVNGTIRYLVPTAELILIKTNSPDILVEEHSKGTSTFQKVVDKSFNEVMDDVKITDATIRDFVAVLYRKPVSNKKWLNDLINNK
jgi:hypothetical protein